MVRIYQFDHPLDHSHAEAYARGSWVTQESASRDELCPECTGPLHRPMRTSPLVLEWAEGSDQVGDFVWVGLKGDAAIRVHIGEELAQRFGGIVLGPVEMTQDAKLRRPKRVTKRTKRRVWLPYEGPPLLELLVQHWVHADLERSSLAPRTDCSSCGLREYELSGVEAIRGIWDQASLTYRTERVPRDQNLGLFLHGCRLDEASVFRVHEVPGFVFCTEPVREFILTQGYSNVSFLEVGETY